MLPTDRGSYESLAHLRYAYTENYQGNPPIEKYLSTEGWNEDTLHISELGKCPRQQMYRLLKQEKQPRALSTLANESLMYIQANWIHALTVGALDWAGILIAHERSLPGLPDGWSGHYDALFADRETNEFVGADFKTVRSNAFNFAYSWPKPEHVWQVQGYLAFLPRVKRWYIEYIDRGGAKTPQYRVIERDDAKITDRIRYLNMCRSLLESDEIIYPYVLPPEFSLYYRKVNNMPYKDYNTAFVGPSWQCEWCPYHHGIQNKVTKEWTTYESSPCKPDMTKKQVGKTEKNIFKCISPEHEESLNLYLKSQLLRIPIEEEDVD